MIRTFMNPNACALIGLTAIVAALIGVLVFAVLRFAAAARESRQHLRENSTESAFVTAALHEALTKVKAQEREMSARAEASERLSSEIVESLSSGLLVVASNGQLRILNPAGRRLLSRDDSALAKPYRDCPAGGAGAARRRVSEERGADRPPHAANQRGRSIPGVSRRQRVAALEWPGRAARRDLPVHRSDASRGNGRAAAIERKPCASRRADRGHRA